MHGRAAITAHVHVRFGFTENPYHVDVSVRASAYQRRIAIFIHDMQVGAEPNQDLHMIEIA